MAEETKLPEKTLAELVSEIEALRHDHNQQKRKVVEAYDELERIEKKFFRLYNEYQSRQDK